MSGQQMIPLFLSAVIQSVVFTMAAMFFARKMGILDRPEERKIHVKPIPLLGGVAVFASFAMALIVNFRFSIQLKGVLIASFIIMLFGLADDIKGLPASLRLLVQVVCAFVVIHFGIFLKSVPAAVPFAHTLNIVITIIWIVGITNAVNFMDGADGLATGMAVIISGTFFIAAYLTGQVYFAFLNLSLCGACAGFLVFNRRPAKIFLGDAGSSFIGFSLAVFAAMGDWAKDNPVVSLSVPLLVLAIPVFDVIYISISRIARGKVRTVKEWIEYVGKDHLHHRLMALGFSQGQMVVFIWGLNIALALGALVLKNASTYQAVLLLFQGASFLVLVMILMLAGRREIEQVNGNLRKSG